MCFEVCGINGDGLIVRGLFGQSHHDPREHAHITPVDRQHMRSMCERGRFQRLYNVFGGPYSTGASHHRNPLRLMKIMPLRTRRSSTRARPRLFGKYGRSRCICASVSQ